MRICHIWDSEYPWDVRAEKVSQALTEAGHEVHMVARNRDGRPTEERLEECTVHRLETLPGIARLPVLGRGLNSASMFPAFFNPRWIRKIRETAVHTGAEVILCRDIPLIPAAVWVGRGLGIPVVLDMAENYPAMIRAVWENGRQRWFDLAVRNPKFVEWIERWAIRTVDHIVVVVEESRDRLVGLGVPPEKITVVSNTPPKARVTAPAAAAASRRAGDPLELVYLGLLEAPRGIATLIRAVGISRAKGLDVRLTLIGDGRERQDFEMLTRNVDPTGEAIRFLGYVQNAEAQRLLRAGSAGVIPHHADDSWTTTIPNKLFDYMAAGITVISSDVPPVRRIIEATGCGLVFADRDDQDLARAIEALYSHPDLGRFGAAGRRAVEDCFNWEEDAERLLAAVKSVANRESHSSAHGAEPSSRREVAAEAGVA